MGDASFPALYTKETRETLTGLVNTWIRAPINGINGARTKLLNQLHFKEREYLTSYYQPKEPLFLRAYISQLPNLGVHSTQRNEGYHPITKRNLNKNLPISKAIDFLVNDLEQLLIIHEKRVNDDRKSRPTLLDLEAFGEVANHSSRVGGDEAGRG